MLSLATVVVGDTSDRSDWLVGDMLLQDRVLVSPDITHTLNTLNTQWCYCT